MRRVLSLGHDFTFRITDMTIDDNMFIGSS